LKLFQNNFFVESSHHSKIFYLIFQHFRRQVEKPPDEKATGPPSIFHPPEVGHLIFCDQATFLSLSTLRILGTEGYSPLRIPTRENQEVTKGAEDV